MSKHDHGPKCDCGGGMTGDAFQQLVIKLKNETMLKMISDHHIVPDFMLLLVHVQGGTFCSGGQPIGDDRPPRQMTPEVGAELKRLFGQVIDQAVGTIPQRGSN